MPNIIAKKINLTIDTIDSKPIRLKDNFVIGDSIELSISLTENKTPKDITGARIRLLVSNEGVFEQVNNIEISDATKGLIKIQLEPHMINKLNMNLYQIIIEDLDENINCQKFIVNVIDSLATQVILEAQDGLSTLVRLNQEIDNYTVALNDIKQHVSDISKDVDTEIISINNKLKIIDDSIVALDNKLNNTSDSIDRLPKLLRLKPYVVSGSNNWYFATDILTMSALDLLNCGFELFIKGKVYNDTTVQSCKGDITFQMVNSNVRAYLFTSNDIVVQGKTISPTLVFQNLSSEISASSTGFRLLIKSNISKALNYESELYCTLLSNGENLR